MNKKLEKTLVNLEERIRFLETNKIETLRSESEELKTIKEQLSHIKLKVKDVKTFDGEQLGDKVVRISFSPIVVNLTVDNEGNVSVNNFLKNCNLLGLVSYDDQIMIQKELSKLKK